MSWNSSPTNDFDSENLSEVSHHVTPRFGTRLIFTFGTFDLFLVTKWDNLDGFVSFGRLKFGSGHDGTDMFLLCAIDSQKSATTNASSGREEWWNHLLQLVRCRPWRFHWTIENNHGGSFELVGYGPGDTCVSFSPFSQSAPPNDKMAKSRSEPRPCALLVALHWKTRTLEENLVDSNNLECKWSVSVWSCWQQYHSFPRDPWHLLLDSHRMLDKWHKYCRLQVWPPKV